MPEDTGVEPPVIKWELFSPHRVLFVDAKLLVRAVVGGHDLCLSSPLAPLGERGSGVRGR